MSWSKKFSALADNVSTLAGRPSAFIAMSAIVVVWAVSGPFFNFSETWQLVINTGTTIITFLMVFLIQNSQNRDGAAIQAKLDELIRASAAHNRFIGIEKLTDEELATLREKDSERAKKISQALEAAEAAEDYAQDKADEAERRA